MRKSTLLSRNALLAVREPLIKSWIGILPVKHCCFRVVELRNSRAITRIPRLEPALFNRQSIRPRLNQRFLSTLVVITLALAACTQAPQTMVTIADARNHPARLIDTGEPGDSMGDILVFDQPLLDKDKNKIGRNSGTCIRTRVGVRFQCQWTLTFGNKIKSSGSIVVAGREFDKGTSTVSIIGGTGNYSGISGEMESTNNNDGTFTQVLRYTIR